MVRAELAAGSIDLGSAVTSHRGIDAQLLQAIAKCRDLTRVAPLNGISRCWIERDQIDVGPERSTHIGQLHRVPVTVVHAIYESPLE